MLRVILQTEGLMLRLLKKQMEQATKQHIVLQPTPWQLRHSPQAKLSQLLQCKKVVALEQGLTEGPRQRKSEHDSEKVTGHCPGNFG